MPVVIQDISQQPAEFGYCSLRLVRIKGYQSIDIVQGVQQEVRVQLIPEVFQLGIRPALFRFNPQALRLLSGNLGFPPTVSETYRNSYAYHQYQRKKVPEEKQDSGIQFEAGSSYIGRGGISPRCNICIRMLNRRTTARLTEHHIHILFLKRILGIRMK